MSIIVPRLNVDENPFDIMRQTHDDGSEYWATRDLQTTLGYVKWQEFDKTIERAKTVMMNTHQDVADHIIDANSMVSTGSGAVRTVGKLYCLQ